MDVMVLIPALFLITAGGVIVFSLVSKAKTEQKLQDEDSKKSTLAADS